MIFSTDCFSPSNEAVALSFINRVIATWPWCRPLTPALLAHWRSLGPAFQPGAIQIALADGKPQAFLHGERFGDRYYVHLLALAPGQARAGLDLLRQAEAAARALGCQDLLGPSPRSALFYGGYILGSEPYHPHWSVDSTDAFVQAGYHLSCIETLMVHELSLPVEGESLPAGYILAETSTDQEFEAESFRYAALKGGREVAYCAARAYPGFKQPNGGCLAQIGGVGTDEAHRERGLARVLSKTCLQRLKTMGASEVLISTGLENGPALKVYERIGFQRRTHLQEWMKRLV